MAPERLVQSARPFSFTGRIAIQRPYTPGDVVQEKRCESPALPRYAEVWRRDRSWRASMATLLACDFEHQSVTAKMPLQPRNRRFRFCPARCAARTTSLSDRVGCPVKKRDGTL